MKITIKQNRKQQWIWIIRVNENGIIKTVTGNRAYFSAADAADSVALFLRSNQ